MAIDVEPDPGLVGVAVPILAVDSKVGAVTDEDPLLSVTAAVPMLRVQLKSRSRVPDLTSNRIEVLRDELSP